MEDGNTRTMEMIPGPRGTVRLRFSLEGDEIYLDGAEWHLQHPLRTDEHPAHKGRFSTVDDV
jgi:hypothetical protein